MVGEPVATLRGGVFGAAHVPGHILSVANIAAVPHTQLEDSAARPF